MSNNGFSKKCSVVPVGPSEREQMIPMIQHETVTMIAAGRAGIMTDMVIVMRGVCHRLFADRTIRSVIINAFERLCIGGELVRAEIQNVLSSLAEAGNKRIVGVQDQLSFIINAVQKRVINPFRMTVSCQLVAIQVGNDVMRGLDIAEGVTCKALVTFDQQYIGFNFSAKRSAAKYHCRHAFDLVGSFAIP